MADSLKRIWCWKRLRDGEEDGNRGWDGYGTTLYKMIFLPKPRRWWRTRKHGMLHSSMGLQRRTWVRNWTKNKYIYPIGLLFLWRILLQCSDIFHIKCTVMQFIKRHFGIHYPEALNSISHNNIIFCNLSCVLTLSLNVIFCSWLLSFLEKLPHIIIQLLFYVILLFFFYDISAFKECLSALHLILWCQIISERRKSISCSRFVKGLFSLFIHGNLDNHRLMADYSEKDSTCWERLRAKKRRGSKWLMASLIQWLELGQTLGNGMDRGTGNAEVQLRLGDI